MKKISVEHMTAEEIKLVEDLQNEPAIDKIEASKEDALMYFGLTP